MASNTDQSPGTTFFAITPSDTVDLTTTTRGIFVGVAGDVVAIGIDDTVAVTLKGVVAGVWHPGCFKRIKATNTTATNIIGCR